MKYYKTKWILTSAGEILQDKALVVDEGKIVDIIEFDEINAEPKLVKELGNSVVTPGFINMFEQLQYSNIGKVKPNRGIKYFFQTIVKNYTFAGVENDNYCRKWANILSEYFCWDRNQKKQSYKDGLIETIKSGVTCVAQVSKGEKYFNTINKAPIKTYLFFEVYADTSIKSKQMFKMLRERVERLVFQKGENTYIGIALNSISGVHRKLWELFSKYCRKHNMLIMTRFAESKDEIEWLQHGFSDIDLLHKYMGFRKITPYQKGLSPVEYLEKLNVLSKKVIVANANYVDKSELQKLADNNVKFVYMPRYDDEICNKKQEFPTILEVFKENFAFSTQSFGPNRRFSLLEVAKNVNNNRLDTVELLKYLTIYPAKILRLDNIIGSIEVGKDADFNVFNLADGEDYNAIFDKLKPNSVYAKGRKLIKGEEIRFSLD